MNDYDFKNINDKEFEVLSCDILSEFLEIKIERFKAGRDGGVDGRFYSNDSKEVIVQCKHWANSSVNKLISKLKNEEYKKVKALNPSRYILTTSLSLSRKNKFEIQKSLAPFIISESDIFGKEDLNDLLSKYEDIEKKHYKLWLASTNVLVNILNSGILGRSNFTLERIKQNSRKYVLTSNHDKALSKLDNKHSLIITGAPGIGKSTLADQMCLYYATKGYHVYFIDSDLSEAEYVYEHKSKQVFYFDDFLGRNFLSALNQRQDSKVVNFMKRIEGDERKRFILTSRTNVLNRGKELADIYHINNIHKNEFELEITSLSDFDKAKILYNHIWFSDLNEDYIEELFLDKRYLKIIKHTSFNPRLISFITDSHKLSSVSSDQYWQHVSSSLANPEDIWRNVFEIQITDLSRVIIIAITLKGKSIKESELLKFIRKTKRKNIFNDDKFSIESTLKTLVGALLNRTHIEDREVYYDLFNPSIADFVLNTQLSEPDSIVEILMNLSSSEALLNFKRILSQKVKDKELVCEYVSILSETYFSKEQHDFSSEEYLFVLDIILLDSRATIIYQNKIIDSIKVFMEDLNAALTEKQIEILYLMSLTLDWDIDKNNFAELIEFSLNYFDYDEYTLVTLSQLVDELGIGCYCEDSIKSQIINFVSNDLNEIITDSQVFDGVLEVNSIDEKDERIYKIVEEKLSSYEVSFTSKEISDICSKCDFPSLHQYLYDYLDYEDDSYQKTDYQDLMINDIEDLFQRD